MSEHRPLSVLVVEDQALVAMELQLLIEDAGHDVFGWATDLDEALSILDRASDDLGADLAMVDIHLGSGPSGTELAADLRKRGIPVVFMTANAKRIPDDFVGAVGLLAKPYTAHSVMAALAYLHLGVRDPPPSRALPPGLKLSPVFSERWAAS